MMDRKKCPIVVVVAHPGSATWRPQRDVLLGSLIPIRPAPVSTASQRGVFSSGLVNLGEVSGGHIGFPFLLAMIYDLVHILLYFPSRRSVRFI